MCHVEVNFVAISNKEQGLKLCNIVSYFRYIFGNLLAYTNPGTMRFV